MGKCGSDWVCFTLVIDYDLETASSGACRILTTQLPDKMIAARESETELPSLVAKAYGTVLELGPGSGNQLSRYDVSKINRIYGVEPNVDLHAALRNNIKKNGLSDVYTLVPCGLEDSEKLAEYGVQPGSMDTVMSVQVLCSVPEPAASATALYRLLKPGGQMIVYEHVRSEDYVSRSVQRTYLFFF